MKKSFVSAVSLFFAAVGLLIQPLATTVMAQTSSPQRFGTQSSAPTQNLSEIHLKFADSTGVVLRGGVFASQTGTDLTSVNSLLNKKAASKNRLFADSYENITAQRAQAKAKSGKNLADLNGYFTIKLQPNTDSESLLTQLKQLPYITEAYFAPLAAPAPATADYSALQGYRNAAPNGMGVNAIATQVGAKGDNVQIADLEYSWNTAHEDISDGAQVGARLNNGTPSDPFTDDNHGTAVTGITNGDNNTIGVNGITPNAKLKLVNTNNVERGWDVANAVNLAQANLQPGDIMLIEQQAWGPNSTYAPIEWIPAVYDAITYATANGIIVIEPAANGGKNLDDPIYQSVFTTAKPNSGAIMVGAGAACGSQAARSRLGFSNYGSRVDVQGWGECVTTTGYGDLSNLSKNQWYTSRFNGTSSASALVAAIAASASSAKEAQSGATMTSAQMRALLISTGTAQDTSVNSGKIGPLPNLAAALAGTDTSAPTAPSSLTVSVSATQATLSWKAATDNVGVKSYKIYRDGTLLATTSSLSYIDASVRKNTTYIYKVQAVDAAGNASGYSNSVTAAIPRK